ncbi:MAG: single-stranded DNA-binding protein [bacterium]|nr:single-stranded DNA-binding protein [bacterium]MCX7917943.1 single-stranded DNA-binding protein [bacterium]MDW8164258.1 single-stranded DNA-binding protein [Candidatus Omnitrophota bacterium]
MPGPSLNKVFLIGRLTRDPELRYTTSGTAVATFGLAVNREFLSKGERKEDTCYLNLVVWGKQAEICAEYLKKGNLIFVEGCLQYRTWETEDSEKKSVVEVRVERFQFLEKPNIEIIEEKEELENGKEEENL